MPSTVTRSVAAGTALLGAFSLLTAVLLFATAPDDPSVARLAAGIAVTPAGVCALAGTLALVESAALLLAGRRRNPAERAEWLLAGGAVAGGLSVLLLVTPLLPRVVDVPTLGPEWGPGVGIALVPIGVVCTAAGVAVRRYGGPRSGTPT
ncbi:hypothetical protein [Halostella litorea]|uniref:hypothetical protein n=1 Tax=Halostella litorea TaxID=2528831 RepID=UPI001091F5B7|nr:hypothetical protein [Halostella litorea]